MTKHWLISSSPISIAERRSLHLLQFRTMFSMINLDFRIWQKVAVCRQIHWICKHLSSQNNKTKQNPKTMNLIFYQKKKIFFFVHQTSCSAFAKQWFSVVRETNEIKKKSMRRISNEAERRDWWSPVYFDETLTRFLLAFLSFRLDASNDRVFRSFISLSIFSYHSRHQCHSVKAKKGEWKTWTTLYNRRYLPTSRDTREAKGGI